jgi:bifunctional DNA-binding transcriptional regulator/antitoxin component of YhaV-PrlF toxin-antitoxin module
VLPQAIRRNLKLRAGDDLDANVEGESIVRIPKKKRTRRSYRGRIIKDAVTGLPVLTAGKNAPVLTQKEVEDIMYG